MRVQGAQGERNVVGRHREHGRAEVDLNQVEVTGMLVPQVRALTQRQATELALDKTVPQLLVERLSRLGLQEGDDVQLRLLGRHETAGADAAAARRA